MRRSSLALPVIVLAVTLGVLAAWWVRHEGGDDETRGSRRPSVLLITVDTLRADRLGSGRMPALDALAARGLTFTGARAAAPLTLPSHVTILTGAWPSRHGVRENGINRFDGSRPTLATILKANGYRTAAFVSAFVLDRRFGLNAGFDEYDDRVPRRPEAVDRLEAERTADTTVDAALAWLRPAAAAGVGSSPYFLWVHLYDPHAPYEPPTDFLARAGGSAYDGEVAFTDAQIARLIEAVRADLDAGRLVIAAAGDHGESLGDHGEATHGLLLYDGALRVPLIIAAPGRLEPASRSTPVSLADLAPTLLRLAGVDQAPAMDGVDLVAPSAARDVYAETVYPRAAGWSPLHALVEDRWKLIASSEAELYDVVADPAEQTNVAGARPEIVRAMQSKLDQLKAAAGDSASPATVSPEAAARLRALGYVAAAPSPPASDAGSPNPALHVASWNGFEAALSDLASGRAASAAAALGSLAARHPGAPVFQTTYARALLESGAPRRALAQYRKAAALWPTDASLLHDLAVAAREAGAQDEAMKAERAALALDDRHPAAHNGIGLLAVERERWREAVEAFTRATELDPTNASYWTNLGNASGAAGNPAAAERAYRQALTLDARYTDAANGLGVLLVQAGRPAEAVTWFEHALAGNPGFYEAWLNLGIAYRQLGESEKARSALRRVLDTAPPGARERDAARRMLEGR
jgi:arylsulfatase A-like enzyme/Flp pilus assembly protein TadD